MQLLKIALISTPETYSSFFQWRYMTKKKTADLLWCSPLHYKQFTENDQCTGETHQKPFSKS